MSPHLPGNPYGSVTPNFASTTDAVFALTYEQRTANLIAFLSADPTGPRQEVHEQIMQRLGLRDEAGQ
ncbi:hypothetical protein [Dietzia sp. 179-F 9C3 NHS]|uniref:hypothetical protein n=1 Tax=Dietzia sp. 179-F 9C3 NHS TaxID=3374295 RepID=UPI003879A72A